MSLYYCVLWMPTIIHKSFEKPLRKSSDMFEISDGLPEKSLKKGDSLLWVKLQFGDTIRNGINIDFFKDKFGEQKIVEASFFLEFKDYSHNGLILFTINLPDNHFLNKANNFEFPCDIYHKIKEFFHEHEYHDFADGDSIILPYVCGNEVKIKENDNLALNHYFSEYSKKFELNSIATKRLYDNILSSKFAELFFFFYPIKYKQFFKIISTVRGDLLYYNSLFYSCYNTHHRFDINFDEINTGGQYSDEKNKNRRRLSFNIKNRMDSIMNMEDAIINKFTLSNSKISFSLAVLAIILSILSLIYTFN